MHEVHRCKMARRRLDSQFWAVTMAGVGSFPDRNHLGNSSLHLISLSKRLYDTKRSDYDRSPCLIMMFPAVSCRAYRVQFLRLLIQ